MHWEVITKKNGKREREKERGEYHEKTEIQNERTTGEKKKEHTNWNKGRKYKYS